MATVLKGIDENAITYEDCKWVVQNIENLKVRPDDAPSSTAWGLLVRAKDERSKVYEWVLNHIAPKSYVQETVDKWERDPARKLINIEEQILAEAGIQDCPEE